MIGFVLLLAADFVTLPAGSFVFGCNPPGTCPDHVEARTVSIDKPLAMMRTEVTVRDFRAFVKRTGYVTEAEQKGERWVWSRPRAYKLEDKQPVMYMTLRDADTYCADIGARLPNEAEWSYAFRAGNPNERGHLYANTDGRYVWFRENSRARPQPVGTRLPNAWGLFDLEGNAWEITRSMPGEKANAVARGGSWASCPVIEGKPWDKPGDGFGFSRCPLAPSLIRDNIGFRCVK